MSKNAENVENCRKLAEHVENRRIRQTHETGIIEESQLILKFLVAPIFEKRGGGGTVGRLLGVGGHCM